MSIDRYEDLKNVAKNCSVLIVDDDNIMRTVLDKNLSHYFKNTDSATDGNLALEAYKSKNYDLILTDIYMKNLSGLEMIKKIRKINPKQKIIVMSMNKDSDTLIELINYKIDGFVLKPFARKIFFDKIVEVLST